MKAAQFSSFGTPGVLDIVDVETPVPGPGETLVRFAGAGVDQLDMKIGAAARQQGAAASFPLGTGFGVAGRGSTSVRESKELPWAASCSAPVATPWPSRRS